jgi:hypothetical protein
VSIPELPLTISILCQSREETACGGLMSLQVDLDFDPRSRNNCEIWRDGIYAKTISPMKVDVLYRARKTLDPCSSGFAVRKRKLPVHSHEEGWAVNEVLAPG